METETAVKPETPAENTSAAQPETAPVPKKTGKRKKISAGHVTVPVDEALPEKTNLPQIERKLLLLDTADYPDALLLAEHDGDPRWDPRLKLPVPQWLVNSIAERGVDVPIDVTQASEDPLTFYVNDGRMRTRAVKKANEARAKKGLPPLVVPLLLTGRSDLDAMETQVILNEGRIQSDPATKAKTMSRLHDVGYTEGEIAEKFHISTSTVQQYLAILPWDELHGLLAEGKLSLGAAYEIVNQSPEKVTASIAAALKAAGGGRITAKAARTAAGKTVKTTLGRGDITQLILDLGSAKIAGSDGAAAKAAATAALEAVMDPRKVDDFWDVLDKIGKGKLPEFDYNKYQKDGKTAPKEGAK